MAQDLYLGKLFDPATKALGERFELDPSDLTTHGIVIGMTGSGKTGLSIVLIEEALQAGIPVIAIDPKGDVGNLALVFPQLRPEDFAPWVEPDAASTEQAATEAAAIWSKGLAEWGLGTADLQRYADSRDVRLITPGSLAGIPLNIIESLSPPGPETRADDEEFHDQIDSVVRALLGLVGVQADAMESREYILLFTLVENAWRQDRALTLETLINEVATPPIDRLGALPLDSAYPAAERRKLMLSLNNLLASPPMQAWRQGEPIDIGAWLRAADGRPRLSIVYTAHLDDDQRLFVTALLLSKLVSWMRQQPGTNELRCLLYIDEIFGYFPPTMNPPTKKPLLTLLKQARAFGVGVLLSTQNPVDLDYRGLANMGFWAIGRLQTKQDQERIREGIEAALEDSALGDDFSELMSAVEKRVFLIHDIHRPEPALVHSRWAMSYLRGPLTRDEIERLSPAEAARTAATPEATPVGLEAGGITEPAPATASVATATSAPAAPAAAATGAAAPPPLPAGLTARFLNRHGGTMAEPHLLVKAAVRYKVGTASTDETTHNVAFHLDPQLGPVETLEATPAEIDDAQLSETPPGNLSFAELPSYLAEGTRPIERALRERLDERFAVELLYDPATKTVSRPGETEDGFVRRVQGSTALDTKRDRIQKRLDQKRAQLAARQSETKGRSLEKWASIGTAILSNIGIVRGRKRTATGVGGVLSKQRMETTARETAERLTQEIAQLEAELAEAGAADPSRFERRTVKPARSDVAIIRYEVVWIY